MPGTLILLFHRDLSQSKANAGLAKAAQTVKDVQVVDMQARYPGGVIDIFTDAGADAEMLLSADRIILQFPIQWYATPALLKAWQDAVLTRMYYIFAEAEGDHLKGTPLMVAATAGNTSSAYGRDGANRYTIDELLTPLKATAHRCGLLWHSPYLVFTADKLEPSKLEDAALGYVNAIEHFISATSGSSTSEAA
ncbi:NAD(P)H-dependent oxidoreductase [Ahrensia kielensis]|uniref:NAD(P)H-dependent oxidoreductase n=1 Tax=Ahrensia kielensis TaxID=76980 RepID=UPI00036A4A78|nr:NAD(P)H-dependent oxidoreductase [Ahrensia kielensis]